MNVEIKQLREDELLELIKRRKKEPDLAKQAWLELYERHVKLIYYCVNKAGSLADSGVDSCDIVEHTFQQVWVSAADTFKPGEYDTAEEARHHVVAWLGKIATREYSKATKSRKQLYLSVHDPSDLDERPCKDEATCEDSELRTLAESVLDPEEQEIVWLKMQYYDCDTGESRVPKEDRETICAKQGISEATFRKRYERALAKIKDAAPGTMSSAPRTIA